MSRWADRSLFYGLGFATWAFGAIAAWVFLNRKPFQS